MVTLTAEEVMTKIETAGMAVGVLTMADMLCDPQLRHRHHFQELEHVERGRRYYDTRASSCQRHLAKQGRLVLVQAKIMNICICMCKSWVCRMKGS